MGSSKTTQKTTQKPTVTPQLQSLYDQLTREASDIVNVNMAPNPYAYASDLTPDELAAFQMVRDNIGVGRGTLDAGVAAQLDALEKSGRAPTQAELNQWMNPFTETVLKRSIEKLQEDADRGWQNISSQAALNKAFGGSRQALLESELARNLNKNTGDLYYSGMKENFDQALANQLGQIDRLSTNAGRALQAAGLQQAYGLADAAALEGIGRTQRQRSDIDLALKGEDFLRLADEPYKDLEALGLATGAISPGSIGSNSTTVTKTQQSPLQSILGLGSIAAGALTGGTSSALMPSLAGLGSGIGGGVGMGSFGSSNLANFVQNLPYFKGWGSKTGGKVPNPMELACGGPVGKYASGGKVKDPNGFDIDLNRPVINNPDGSVSTESSITVESDGRYYNIPSIVNGKRVDEDTAFKAALPSLDTYPNFKTLDEALSAAKKRSNEIGKVRGFAYGGRVGNSWSQGESADVVRATQNPFSNEMQINRNTPASAAMPGIFNVNDNVAPTPVNTQGSFISPSNNPMATWLSQQNQAFAETPYMQTIRPALVNAAGGTVFPQLDYNIGAVSPEMQVTPDRGGNPVANLLDQYKSGVRTNGNSLNKMEMREMLADAPTTFGGRTSQGYAGGGKVELNNSTIPPIVPVNPLSVALYFSGGGKVPNNEIKAYAQGGNVKGGNKIMDTLFSPEGLMMLGLNILGSDASNPFQALGQAGLATLKGMEQQVDPMAELKMQYEQMRIQNLQDQITNRQFDNEFGVMKWEEQLARQKEMDDLRRSQWEADYAYRAAEDERRRIARENDEDKPPKFRQADYPTLAYDLREFQKLQGAPDKETGLYDYDRLDELANNIEATAGEILDAGFEPEANKYFSAVEQYRANKDKRLKPVRDAVSVDYYNLR